MKGAARESDQRSGAQLPYERGDRLGDDPHVTRLQRAKPGQIPFPADGLADHRADAGLNVHIEAQLPATGPLCR